MRIESSFPIDGADHHAMPSESSVSINARFSRIYYGRQVTGEAVGDGADTFADIDLNTDRQAGDFPVDVRIEIRSGLGVGLSKEEMRYDDQGLQADTAVRGMAGVTEPFGRQSLAGKSDVPASPPPGRTGLAELVAACSNGAEAAATGAAPFAEISGGMEAAKLVSAEHGLAGPLIAENSGARDGPGVRASPTPASSALLREVVRQMAPEVRSLPGEMSEITLRPEELGRVRMRVSGQEGQILLQIMAERGETQELLRRHIDIVERAFRDLGYSDIAFEFAASGEQGHEARDEAMPREPSPETDEPRAGTAPGLPSVFATGATRLDIRI